MLKIKSIDYTEQCFSLFIEPIKYFSFIYDEIIIESTKNLDLIKNIFYYDNTIKYNIELKDLELKKKYIFNNNIYSKDNIYEIMNISKKKIDSL